MMACRLTADVAGVNRATESCVSALRALILHVCALRLLDARMGRRSDVANLGFLMRFPASGANVARTPAYRQVGYLWNLLRRLESVAGSMLSQVSGFTVALSITLACQRKNSVAELPSTVASTLALEKASGFPLSIKSLSQPNGIGG